MMNDKQWPLRRGGRKKPPISARPERMLAATYGGRKKLPISARFEEERERSWRGPSRPGSIRASPSIPQYNSPNKLVAQYYFSDYWGEMLQQITNNVLKI